MSEPSRSLSDRLARMPPGRHLLPRDFVSQNQRERLLLATAELVAERGYQKTTIEAIAKSARVALVTFYQNFESKEDCFLAAFDQCVADAGEVLAELLEPARPWPEQVVAAVEVLLALIDAEPARARLCLVASQAAGTAALARYQALLESLAPKLRQGRELNPHGERLPPDLEVALIGGSAWLIQQRLSAAESGQVKPLLPEIVQVVLTPYIGEAAASHAAEKARAEAAA